MDGVVEVPGLAEVVTDDGGGAEGQVVVGVGAEQAAVMEEGKLGVDFAVLEEWARRGPGSTLVGAFEEDHAAGGVVVGHAAHGVGQGFIGEGVGFVESAGGEDAAVG